MQCAFPLISLREIRGNNKSTINSNAFKVAFFTGSCIVSENEITEKQTSVIVYTFLFFNSGYHFVCDIFGRNCFEREFKTLYNIDQIDLLNKIMSWNFYCTVNIRTCS